MISRKMMTKKFVQKLQMRKSGFKKDLRALSHLQIVFSELKSQTTRDKGPFINYGSGGEGGLEEN